MADVIKKGDQWIAHLGEWKADMSIDPDDSEKGELVKWRNDYIKYQRETMNELRALLNSLDIQK